MKRRGQFYIVMAIILVVIILGFAGVSNLFKKSDDVRIYDLKDELNIEGAEVVDYGVYKEYDQTSMNSLIEKFTRDYSLYAGEGKELYFIYGNEAGVHVGAYQDVVIGSISINLGAEDTGLEITRESYTTTTYSPDADKKVKIKIDESSYDFELKPNQNFYFVIAKKTDTGRYIEKGGLK